jgi:hypothetical protein
MNLKKKIEEHNQFKINGSHSPLINSFKQHTHAQITKLIF